MHISEDGLTLLEITNEDMNSEGQLKAPRERGEVVIYMAFKLSKSGTIRLAII